MSGGNAWGWHTQYTKTKLLILFVTDLSSEQTLVQRIAELQVKLQYLDSMYRSRQEDVQVLTQQLGNIFTDANSSGDLPTPRHVNSLQVRLYILKFLTSPIRI